MFKNLIFLLVLLPCASIAQFTISGRVLNQADTKPLANVSVFLSNATIGSKTGIDGNFNLVGITPGKYELVISMVGFEPYSKTILIDGSNMNLADVVLFPKTIGLKEVTIKVNRNREKYFELYYERFKTEFLGKSDFALECKILNPDVLDFDFDAATNTLTVSSSGFLDIENNALGYKIEYLLTKLTSNYSTRDFQYEGQPLFTEMTGTPAQEHRWQQNRKQAYEGSMMHFLRSALNNKLGEDGFKVLRLAITENPERPADSIIKARIKKFDGSAAVAKQQGISPDSLSYWKKKDKLPKILYQLIPSPLMRGEMISQSDQPGLFALGCNNDQLLVNFNKNHRFTDARQLQDLGNLFAILNKANNRDLTLLDFKEPYAFFDHNGWLVNNNSLVLNGALAGHRLAELLPVNYAALHTQINNADSLLTSLANKMDTWSSSNIREKIHLHFDRHWYDPGDTIWFKGYAVSGQYHQLSGLSGIMYAELINNKNVIVNRLTLRLDSGICKGDFVLSNTCKSGIYQIRAYTNWMRNDSDYFYSQKIFIGSLPARQEASAGKSDKTTTSKSSATAGGSSQKNAYDVQFFPESGDLINGLRSRVAFKAISSNGLSVGVEGSVTDQDGSEVAAFNTLHAGMGQFAFIPQSGKHYTATIKTADSIVFKADLPKAMEEGFTMAVNNAGDSLFVKIATNAAMFKNYQHNSFYLIAGSAGKFYFATSDKLENPVVTTLIPKSRFPSGIVQFTLFSQNGTPLCERLVFIQSPDHLNLTVSSKKTSYSPFEKVNIDLAANDAVMNPVSGTFSVSVTDETKVPVDENAEQTIFTDLLLGSELKGNIENPNYYFLNPNDQTRSDLDLLMLTQGFRKFNWKQVLSGQSPKQTYTAENTLSLSGTIKTPGNKPLPNSKVFLTYIKDLFAKETLTDANGNFKFTNLDFPDTAKVVVNAKKANGGVNVKITLDNPPIPPVKSIGDTSIYTGANIPPQILQAMAQAFIDNKNSGQKNIIELKEVKVESRANSFFQPHYSDNMKYSTNLNGPGNADQVLLGEKLVGCIRLSDCLRGKLYGVTFTADGQPISIRAQTRHLSGAQPMVIYVDGSQRGPSDLDNLNAEDIYSIEVLTSVSYLSLYGSEAPNGALIITMKMGTDIKPSSADGVITYRFPGYHQAREFYSPKYEASATPKSDDRKTIYWNPGVVTDEKGLSSFEYFNAGSKGTYRVVIEGIDASGNLGRQVYSYIVK